jgi:dihydroceramidase
MQLSSIVIFYVLSGIICLPVVVEARSVWNSHRNPHDVKHFETELDTNIGYWSPSTSSIDWCERNYAVTQYIAEFWNCISSILMCLSAGILIIRGLYNKIETRFLLLSLSFGFIGFGSAYFHGTLTHYGQMVDELSMVYTMIVWWFILFRMNEVKTKSKMFSIDMLLIAGIFYGFVWTYVHSLKSFVLVFQLHHTLMIIGGIVKLIYLYRHIRHHTRCIMYLIMAYIVFLVIATICWTIDQQLCERMNSIDGFNPQLHAWWHVFIAVDFHVSVVCTEAMRLLSVKYQQHQMQGGESAKQVFKPEDHVRIVFYLGLPFVDYSKDKLNKY